MRCQQQDSTAEAHEAASPIGDVLPQGCMRCDEALLLATETVGVCALQSLRSCHQRR